MKIVKCNECNKFVFLMEENQMLPHFRSNYYLQLCPSVYNFRDLNRLESFWVTLYGVINWRVFLELFVPLLLIGGFTLVAFEIKNETLFVLLYSGLVVVYFIIARLTRRQIV